VLPLCFPRRATCHQLSHPAAHQAEEIPVRVCQGQLQYLTSDLVVILGRAVLSGYFPDQVFQA
jgi:hypothetical protein